MGCFGSKSAEAKSERGRAFRRPVWSSEYPMTRAELQVTVTAILSLCPVSNTAPEASCHFRPNVKSFGIQLHIMVVTEVNFECLMTHQQMLCVCCGFVC